MGNIPGAQQTIPPPPSRPPKLDFIPLPPAELPPPRAPVLRLSETLFESQLGLPTLPSIGSASHHLGSCRPCAFLHTKGCANGIECIFCHFCEPGEKKRRRKDKIAMRRELRNQGTNVMQSSW